MKKIGILFSILISVFILSGCTASPQITCGEGTIIKDGQCVAPEDTNVDDDQEDEDENENKVDVNCDSFTGDVFYHANFTELESSLVDNESGNPHTKDNFVIWGSSETGSLLSQTTVVENTLSITGLTGDQLDNYYDTGLGYQFFDFETDVTYSVCAVIEGTKGHYVTAELGIYYGHGQRDDFVLSGELQQIVQDFKPTLSTNVDRGQFVLFIGNVTGEFTVHEIKIIKNQ